MQQKRKQTNEETTVRDALLLAAGDSFDIVIASMPNGNIVVVGWNDDGTIDWAIGSRRPWGLKLVGYGRVEDEDELERVPQLRAVAFEPAWDFPATDAYQEYGRLLDEATATLCEEFWG